MLSSLRTGAYVWRLATLPPPDNTRAQQYPGEVFVDERSYNLTPHGGAIPKGS